MDNLLILYPSPDICKDSRFGYSISSLTLATILQDSFNVKYIDMFAENISIDSLCSYLITIDLDIIIVFIDSTPLHRSLNYLTSINILKFIKENNLKTITIACGYFCISVKKNIENADYTFFHEPELLAEYIIKNNLSQLNHIQNENTILVDDIDDLPIPNRALLYSDFEYGRNGKHARAAVINSSRGCIGKCTFCPRVSWNNSKIRCRSIEKFCHEFSILLDNGYKNYWLDDDNFGVLQDRAIQIFDRLSFLAKHYQYGLYLSTWSNIDKEFIDYAKKANVRIISLGVESCSADILRYYKKLIDIEHLKDIVKYADSLGIFIVGNFIIGSIIETESYYDSLEDFINNLPFDSIHIKILSYIVGSELWKSAVKSGKINANEYTKMADDNDKTGCLPLQYLKKIAYKMQIRYYNSQIYKNRLESKIAKFGKPYYV